MFSPYEHFNSPPIQLTHRIFWIAAVLTLGSQFLLGQTPQKTPDRRKTFGQSLKQFVKKAVTKETKENKPTARSENDEDIIKVETNMVVTDVLVGNAKGNAIVGLKKEDFVITENGVPQEMELFSSGWTAPLPKSIVFIVEVGGIPSMADKSLEAAKMLVDKLAPIDRMAIVNTNTQLVLDFTSDKKLLKATLEKLKREHIAGRHSYSSLIASLNELLGPEDTRPIIVNQSEGEEVTVFKPIWESSKKQCNLGVRGMCERNFSYADVVDIVERSRATIYTVVPRPQFIGLSKNEQVKRAQVFADYYNWESKAIDWEIFYHIETEKALINITHLSGGIANFLEKPEDASGIYDTILTVIENRYTIGYYPKDGTRDGKKRSVKIEVRGHPEYLVVGRKSYFAPTGKE